MRRSGRWAGSLALSALLVGGLSACGGGGEDPDQAALEDERALGLSNAGEDGPLAEPQTVIDGLTEIKNILSDIKNNLGSDAALDSNDAMVPIWEDIGSRVKLEDAAAHAQFQTQWAALASATEAKDKDRTRTAADELLRLADAYLAAHPLGSTSAPSPSATTSPSSTAIPTGSPSASSTATPSSAVSSPGASASVNLGSLDMRGTTISTASP